MRDRGPWCNFAILLIWGALHFWTWQMSWHELHLALKEATLGHFLLRLIFVKLIARHKQNHACTFSIPSWNRFSLLTPPNPFSFLFSLSNYFSPQMSLRDTQQCKAKRTTNKRHAGDIPASIVCAVTFNRVASTRCSCRNRCIKEPHHTTSTCTTHPSRQIQLSDLVCHPPWNHCMFAFENRIANVRKPPHWSSQFVQLACFILPSRWVWLGSIFHSFAAFAAQDATVTRRHSWAQPRFREVKASEHLQIHTCPWEAHKNTNSGVHLASANS